VLLFGVVEVDDVLICACDVETMGVTGELFIDVIVVEVIADDVTIIEVEVGVMVVKVVVVRVVEVVADVTVVEVAVGGMVLDSKEELTIFAVIVSWTPGDDSGNDEVLEVSFTGEACQVNNYLK
jgi:hypothetical protein